MANRNFRRVQALDNEVKIISGHFTTTAGNVATKVVGLGWAVAGAGSGTYTITLEDSYPALLAVNANALGSSDPVEIVSHDVITAKTIVIDCGATDFIGEIHFTLILRNSTVN